jgi:hypothetical protein
MIGKRLAASLHPDDRAFARALLEDPEGTADGEVRFEREDGAWRVLELRGHDRLDDPGIRGIVLVGRDVTERDRYRQRVEALEAALADVDSLVGEMAPALAEASSRLDAAQEDEEPAADDLATVARTHERLADRLSEAEATLDDAAENGDGDERHRPS